MDPSISKGFNSGIDVAAPLLSEEPDRYDYGMPLNQTGLEYRLRRESNGYNWVDHGDVLDLEWEEPDGCIKRNNNSIRVKGTAACSLV